MEQYEYDGVDPAVDDVPTADSEALHAAASHASGGSETSNTPGAMHALHALARAR